jgi:hypothetical protein
VLTTTSPVTTQNAAQNPSTSTPGSTSSTNPTNTAFRTIAPTPSVMTDNGTTTKASAGQMTALATPTTKPASSASSAESMVSPGTIAANSHRLTPVKIVTTAARHSTRPQPGRSSRDRTTARLRSASMRSIPL